MASRGFSDINKKNPGPFLQSEIRQKSKTLVLLACILISALASSHAPASEKQQVNIGNFGLPGILDLPTARRLPDGELILTHQDSLHETK